MFEHKVVIFTSARLKKLTTVLSELIDIRDGYKECDGLTRVEINAFILYLCTNKLVVLYIVFYYY